jgi:DNA-binding NarL/FixJ family response regulator
MRLRVLIAEDHESVARQLRRLLEVECDVIDVVNDGLSLIAAVEALTPGVIVNDDRTMAQRALLLGVLGYILKDDAGEELLPAVHAAQAGRQHVSESIRSRFI